MTALDPTPLPLKSPASYFPDNAADRAFWNQLLDADDKRGMAEAENKRLNAELAAVKVARDGLQNQKAELERMVRALERRLQRAGGPAA